ncbi:MAG: BolA family protein [Janthinobacterium lividum]
MTIIKQEIILRLTQIFAPLILDVIDDSAKHRGHRESGTGQETHFRIMIVSDLFAEQNSVKRHRAVYDVLDDLMKTSVHALSLTLRTPKEHETIKA